MYDIFLEDYVQNLMLNQTIFIPAYVNCISLKQIQIIISSHFLIFNQLFHVDLLWAKTYWQDLRFSWKQPDDTVSHSWTIFQKPDAFTKHKIISTIKQLVQLHSWNVAETFLFFGEIFYVEFYIRW